MWLTVPVLLQVTTAAMALPVSSFPNANSFAVRRPASQAPAAAGSGKGRGAATSGGMYLEVPPPPASQDDYNFPPSLSQRWLGDDPRHQRWLG